MTDGLAGDVLERAHRSLALAPLCCMVVLAVSFLAACGSMNVQVDVIDPAYVETVALQAQLQSQLREAFRPPEEKEAKYGQIRGDLRTALALELPPDEIKSTLDRFEELISGLRKLDRDIEQAVAEQPVGPGRPDVTAPRLNALLLQRQATAEAGVREPLRLLEEIASVARGEPLPLTDAGRAPREGGSSDFSGEEARSRAVRAEQGLKSLTGGLTLTESTLAYAVASAPEDKWALEYNRTFGRGTFGNLNFAVKMVSLADFTIKGVTFDPSKVAQVASKVTTQSLLLAAQIAGVPVTGLSPGQIDTGGALAAQSAALATVLESNQRFAAQEELRQEAIAAILTRIAQEEGNLRSEDPSRRSEAHRAILATYNAYKGLLQYSSE
jgi:hypothetical protein